MNWTTIRLELAASEGFPAGSVSRGYVLRVPLKEDGSIDADRLADTPNRATVCRFWSTEPDERGRVVRADGHWALRCNGAPDRLLPTPRFRTGETVAVTEPGGVSLPFRVANVRRLG